MISYISTLGKEKYVLQVTGISTVFQIVVVLIFIPRYGALGAVLGMITLLVITYSLYYYFVKNTVISSSLSLRKINLIISILIALTIISKYFILSSVLSASIYLLLSSLVGFIVIFSNDDRSLFYSYGKKLFLQWKIL